MNEKDVLTEKIELSLPLNAAYVSAARLTASSIASRMNFHLNEIEDIKVAVSEACTLLIRKADKSKNDPFTIEFLLKTDLLEINITSVNNLTEQHFEDEMGLIMIKALIDYVEIKTLENGRLCFVLIKKHEAKMF